MTHKQNSDIVFFTHKQDNNQPEETQELKELRMQMRIEQQESDMWSGVNVNPQINFTKQEMKMWQERQDQKEFEAVREYEKKNNRNFTKNSF